MDKEGGMPDPEGLDPIGETSSMRFFAYEPRIVLSIAKEGTRDTEHTARENKALIVREPHLDGGIRQWDP